MKYLLAVGLAALSFMASASSTTPDEGMWMPIHLKKNEVKMKSLGLKLSSEDLYVVGKSSMKDAIVWFNGGCTGEIISSQGLVLTNHHCGYDAIATASTKEDNILDNGFWAKNNGQERPVKGMWVSVVVRMEDVTQAVLAKIKGVEEKQRGAKLQGIYKELTAEAIKGTHYEAQVREMYKGNEYYLFVFEKFTDIRLVGTPPQNVGKFGGDTDNWMWPRHTGDFSMFRIYTNAENKPAAYSTANKPYAPKHHLPVSVAGVKEGDFAMIMGFPGRTNRYEFSNGIKLAVEKVNPTIVSLRDSRLKSWKEVMDKSVSDRLLLSSDYASIANYWKYYIGQTEQLTRLKVYDQKKELEARFANFAKGNPEYDGLLEKVNKAYEAYSPYALQRTYLQEAIMAPSSAQLSIGFVTQAANFKTDADVKKMADGMKAGFEDILSTFFQSSDQKIVTQHLVKYFNAIPKEQHPALLATMMKKNKGKTDEESIEKYVAYLYAKSIFGDKAKFTAFTEKPSLKTLTKDPIFVHVSAFYNNYITNFKPKIDEFNAMNAQLGRAYIKGLREMQSDLVAYPDANSSLRLTYGSVQSYDPKDAVHYDFVTTLDGVMEKYVPGDSEFDLPAKLVELHGKKNYGQYAMADGRMPVAFITNNDITGGNSGSPVINGSGHLIGLAFDGNWEAMSGDIVFDKKYKRTINVDIRYVLFLIEKLGGATNIIAELNLVKDEPRFVQPIDEIKMSVPSPIAKPLPIKAGVKGATGKTTLEGAKMMDESTSKIKAKELAEKTAAKAVEVTGKEAMRPVMPVTEAVPVKREGE